MAAPKFLIYALCDPRDNAIRYIGKSSNGLRRPQAHRYPSARIDGTHRAKWLQALHLLGLRATIEIVEVCSAISLNEAERFWIEEFRREGCKLTNHCDGGEGTAGRIVSDET